MLNERQVRAIALRAFCEHSEKLAQGYGLKIDRLTGSVELIHPDDLDDEITLLEAENSPAHKSIPEFTSDDVDIASQLGIKV